MRKNLWASTLLFLLFIFPVSCSSRDAIPSLHGECTDTASAFDGTTGQAPAVTNWLYQLQDASIDEMNTSGFQFLVIDYSLHGTDETRYTSADINTLHASGKKVLAYLSIGEAEEYRYYFNSGWLSKDSSGLNQPNGDAPCWLGRTNPDWEGNYKVQYWSEDWQTVVIGYLDKIMDSGFDGVYLDIIDAWEYWSDSDNGELFSISQSLAAERMINLVQRIAYYARIQRNDADFYVFPQNGEAILDHDTHGTFLNTISGIGIEDLFYNETDPVENVSTSYRITFLDAISAEGKPVIVVDYVDDESGYSGENQVRIDDFYSQVQAKSYIPYAAITDRALDEINTINPIQP